jgi:hypothetical protein
MFLDLDRATSETGRVPACFRAYLVREFEDDTLISVRSWQDTIGFQKAVHGCSALDGFGH